MSAADRDQRPPSDKPGTERWLVVPMFVFTSLLLLSILLALLDIGPAFAAAQET